MKWFNKYDTEKDNFQSCIEVTFNNEKEKVRHIWLFSRSPTYRKSPLIQGQMLSKELRTLRESKGPVVMSDQPAKNALSLTKKPPDNFCLSNFIHKALFGGQSETTEVSLNLKPSSCKTNF